MTTSFTPARALAYLRELSTDIRAAVVFDAAGTLLAGDGSLVVRARELLAAAEPSSDAGSGVRIARSQGSTLLAGRGDGDLAIALLAGPHVVIPLLAHDLRALLNEQIPRHS